MRKNVLSVKETIKAIFYSSLQLIIFVKMVAVALTNRKFLEQVKILLLKGRDSIIFIIHCITFCR